MAIKAGEILHDVHGFVIDRIQTAGVNNVNIPQEKIYELGNYQTVATIRDIADLSFDIEGLDESCELEALITGVLPSAVVANQTFTFDNSMPLDIISPFKQGQGAFNIVKGIAIPYLTLESASYNFGVKTNSTQQFTFKGDSIYYIPGTPKFQRFVITAGVNQVYTLSNTAITYTESGTTIFALSVCARNPTTHLYKRLFLGTDFTNTSTTVTTLANLSTQGYTELNVVYGTVTAGTYNQSVHETVAIKPAAVRGKDIDIYISDGAATPTMIRWTGVQQFQVSRKVNLEANEEFGNYHYVSQDYDTADVTGSVTMKPVDAATLWSMIAQTSFVNTNVVVGAYSSAPLNLECRVRNPDTGAQIKTFIIPDARFTLPGVQGRVQTKLTTTFNFQSDAGSLTVRNG